MIVTSGCFCKIDAGTCSVTGPSIISLIACAFFSPKAINTTFLACIMLALPIQIALLGTSSSLSKKRELALIVFSVNLTS